MPKRSAAVFPVEEWGPGCGSALPPRSLQGIGLMTGSAPGSTPLTPPLGTSSLCTQPSSQQPGPGQRGPDLRLVAGSARLLRACDQPRGEQVQSLNLPVSLHAPPFSTKGKKSCSDGGGAGGQMPITFLLTAAHCMRLICAHHKLLTFLCPGHSSGC